ncbi:MAG: xylose isomerase [Flavobacteriaceae bacterium]|nr:xylose isomerase [Flavobacteriaceae bacterium]
MKYKLFFLLFFSTLIYSQSSKIKALEEKGVLVGVQSYSFRTMDDQSPLAILEYIKKTGIKHVELMGNHVEPFVGINENSKFLSKKRNEISMSKFKELRKLYNDAGISIFAFKPKRCFEKNNTDADIKYGMRAAKALGATHITLEHPEDDKHTLRLSQIAEQEGILIGYHNHEQAKPTLWDTAISQSNYNRLNIDLGHYTATEIGDPIEILKNKHSKIASMHLKDRKKISRGGENMIWGYGDTPIKQAIKIYKKEDYNFPLTIELEYKIPSGSNEISEVKKCISYIYNSVL